MVEKNVKNYMSAKAARQITETSDKMLNIAFKQIKEEAEYGKNETDFCVYKLDTSVITKIKNTLVFAGYAVSEVTEVMGDTDTEEALEPTLVGLSIKW